jgi:hypothetical protein
MEILAFIIRSFSILLWKWSPYTDPILLCKKSILDAATVDAAKQRSYYEIKGFQEGLKQFKGLKIIRRSSI